MPAEKKPTTGKQRAVATPITPTPLPPSIPPELIELFRVALTSLPPNAFSQFIKRHWGWVLSIVTTLFFPLLLTTYSAAQDLLEGPAQLATLAEVVNSDRKEVESLKKQVKELDEKLDRVLWIVQSKDGGVAYPSSQPQR